MSRIILSEDTLTASLVKTRIVVSESAKVRLLYNGALIKDGSAFCNWRRKHCTAYAEEQALLLCEHYGVDRNSRLIVTIDYAETTYQQTLTKPLACMDSRAKYDPLQDPRWEVTERFEPEEITVWRSSENIDWDLYERQNRKN